MNTKWLVTILTTVLLVTAACGGAPEGKVIPNPIPTEPEPLPDEAYGSLTIDWKKGLGDPTTASLAIIAISGIAVADDASIVGVVDDPVAIIMIAGIATYVVVNNPDLIAEIAEVVVYGVEGLRDWVMTYAAPVANEGEQEKEDVQVNPKTNQKKRIAHIDDDALLSRSFTKTIVRMGGVEVTSFLSCEELLAVMTAGTKFDLYIVDNNLGYDLMNGPACVIEIQALHPGALVIGFSGGNHDPGFVKNGAQRWLSKEMEPGQILDFLKDLLK